MKGSDNKFPNSFFVFFDHDYFDKKQQQQMRNKTHKLVKKFKKHEILN